MEVDLGFGVHLWGLNELRMYSRQMGLNLTEESKVNNEGVIFSVAIALVSNG